MDERNVLALVDCVQTPWYLSFGVYRGSYSALDYGRAMHDRSYLLALLELSPPAEETLCAT